MKKEITCKLGCIYLHVNLHTGDWCCPPGIMPLQTTEGTKCQRGYTQSDMDKILEQERAEDEELRKQQHYRA